MLGIFSMFHFMALFHFIVVYFNRFFKFFIDQCQCYFLNLNYIYGYNLSIIAIYAIYQRSISVCKYCIQFLFCVRPISIGEILTSLSHISVMSHQQEQAISSRGRFVNGIAASMAEANSSNFECRKLQHSHKNDKLFSFLIHVLTKFAYI